MTETERDLQTRVIILEDRLREMRHYLYGNNNDGKINKIDQKLDAMQRSIVKLHLIIASGSFVSGGVITFLLDKVVG